MELLGPLPLSKGSRAFLGGSQGVCPPGSSSETMLRPATKGALLQHHSESSLLMGKPHPPSARRFVCVFLLGYFYFLDIKVNVYCVACIKLNVTCINVKRLILGDLLKVTGCDVMGSPFS